ncbi:MAG: recombination regulator RecX [Thiobacillaceae bacterium]
MDLRERALRLLARREHSRAELARKLAAHAGPEVIAALLDALEREGLLSDARYAEALAYAYQGRHGSLRLQQTLRRQGVEADLTDAAVQHARAQDLEACRALWQKKFGAPPVTLKDKARQYRFLMGRGFPAEIVAQVVGDPDGQ